jgi:nuclease HARBI1
MSGGRIAVEWFFGIVGEKFPLIKIKTKKYFSFRTVKLYVACALLTNIENILHCNQISQYFSVPPPSLSEYLV